jgi:hypothetical protein
MASADLRRSLPIRDVSFFVRTPENASAGSKASTVGWVLLYQLSVEDPTVDIIKDNDQTCHCAPPNQERRIKTPNQEALTPHTRREHYWCG